MNIITNINAKHYENGKFRTIISVVLIYNDRTCILIIVLIEYM